MLRDLKLADSRWYSRMEPKPLRVRDRFCLSNRINEPTRVTKTSKSLIDVFLTSHAACFATSGSLHLGLSDHDLIFTVRKKQEFKAKAALDRV